MAKKKKVFKAADYLRSSRLFPTFMYQGKQYLRVGVDIEKDTVTVKNLESGNIKEMDAFTLDQLIKQEPDQPELSHILCRGCGKALDSIEYRNSLIKLLCKKCKK